jgi:threonine synthase
MPSLLSHLDCAYCQLQHDPDAPQTRCTDCGGPLFARYRAGELRGTRTSAAGLWEALSPPWPTPSGDLRIGAPPLVQGEGLGTELDMPGLAILDCGRGPTGSVADLGMAVAMQRARALGIPRVTVPSLGDAARAAAAQGALHGLDVETILAEGSDDRGLHERGATVARLPGTLDRAEAIAPGYVIGTLAEPWRIEGEKAATWPMLLAGHRLPDAVVVPVTEGTVDIALWKAWNEWEAAGVIGPQRPRIVLAQSRGCAPVVRALKKSLVRPSPPRNVSGPWELRISSSPADELRLQVVRASGGLGVSVSYDQMREAAFLCLRRLGLSLGDGGAAALAAARQLRLSGELPRTASVVVLNTSRGGT